MTAGRLIIINGGSSAGKTSMAVAFQEIAQEPYFLLGIDLFWFSMPQKEIDLETVSPQYYSWCEDRDEDGKQYFRILPGKYLNESMLARYKSIAAYLDRGLNVIADEVFWTKEWLLESLRVLENYKTYYIGIRCSDQELSRREAARGDRYLGWARGSQIYAHKDAIYDLEIENSNKSPDECAIEIKNFIESDKAPKAAEEMRAKFGI
ncbi:MAG: chloramphenicol phosphotransferase CPT family protein [Candidatus Obscuribacterales bacterium]|nr:chloramphenicol phosphotransferase CPT family protein [Candidatus Obscuribacterales bacterium]